MSETIPSAKTSNRPYFLHSLTASAANASGFLQVSLSKILGDSPSGFYLNMARRGFPMNANDNTPTDK